MRATITKEGRSDLRTLTVCASMWSRPTEVAAIIGGVATEAHGAPDAAPMAGGSR